MRRAVLGLSGVGDFSQPLIDALKTGEHERATVQTKPAVGGGLRIVRRLANWTVAERDEARDQPGFVVRDNRPMPVCRPRLIEHSAGPPLRDAQPVRVAFDLKRSLQRLEVKDVETITRRAALLPEVRRGGKVVDPESLLRHENRHDERLTGLPR